MEDLVDVLMQSTGLSHAQAQTALDAVMRHMSLRLPSSLVGELQQYLGSAICDNPQTQKGI
jgi:hypothetical protein